MENIWGELDQGKGGMPLEAMVYNRNFVDRKHDDGNYLFS